MAKTRKAGKPWLMASALLGLSRLRQLMKEHQLTLGQAEAELRGQVEEALILMNLPETVGLPRKAPRFAAFSWASAELPERDKQLYASLWDTEERKIKKRLSGWRNLKVNAKWKIEGGKITPHEEKDVLAAKVFAPGSAKGLRSLLSWLVDEAGEHGGKLLIATAYEQSSLDDKAKRRKQLERDSGIIQKALMMLSKDQLRIRRRRDRRGAELQLAKLSLAQQDRQDEERVKREEELRLQLALAKANVRRIKAELKALVGANGKTGHKKLPGLT